MPAPLLFAFFSAFFAFLCASPSPAQNRVLELAGSSSYVQLPSDIFNHLEEATVEAWVRWDDWSYFSQFFAFGSGSQWKAMGVNHFMSYPILQFFIYTVAGRPQVIQAATDLPLGQWCHMAAVSGKGGMRFYLNATLVGRHEFAGSFAAIGNGEDNYLGKSNWQENAEFRGQLDEVRVWGMARSEEQIRVSMSQALTGTEPGLVALWNFDAGDARDSSPHGHHGQMMGGAQCLEAPFPGAAKAFRPVVVWGTVKDAAGLPLHDALVRLEKGGQYAAQMRSDLGGSYRLSLFAAGTYDLSVELGELGLWQRSLRLEEGENRRLDLLLKRDINLSGTVRALDATPLRGVLVQALTADGQVAGTALSDEEGGYRFVHLRPERYRVRCQTPEADFYYGAGPDTTGAVLQVKSGQLLEGIDFHLAPFKQGWWKTYTSLEGLLAERVQGMWQSQDGLLWLASLGQGVWSYDGEKFANLTAQDGLASNRVFALLQDRDGRWWFATEAGVSRYDGEQFTTFTARDGLAEGEVFALCQDREGHLWFGTEKGVSRYDGQRFTTFTNRDGLAFDRVRAVLEDREGHLWLGTEDGVSRYDGQRFTTFTARDGLDAYRIYAIYQDRDGLLWLGTEKGVYSYDGERFAALLTQHNLRYEDARAILQDREGILWFGIGSGLFRYDGRCLLQFPIGEGLTDGISSLFQTREGTLWVATDGKGLFAFHREGLSAFSRADGLRADQAITRLATAGETVWLGLAGGGMWRYGHSGFSALEFPKGRARGDISAIYSDAAGRVVFGGRGSGIWRWDRQGLAPLTFAGDWQPRHRAILDFLQDRDGAWWLATEGGVLRCAGQRCAAFDPLASYQINTLYQDQEGRMWFGSAGNGVFCYDGQGVQKFTSWHGLPSDHVYAIHQTPDGVLWFGTQGGVARFNGSHWDSFTSQHGLAHGRVQDIQDLDGRVYIATWRGGVSWFDGQTWMSLDGRDGLPGEQVNALAVDAQGQLWLGTDKGLARYRPERTPPQVRIPGCRQTGSIRT